MVTRLAVAVVLLLASFSATAVSIPSSVSGGYLTPDRACRAVFSRYFSLWTQLELSCLRWGDGSQTYALYTVYGTCPDEYNVFAFDPREYAPSSDKVAGMWYAGEKGEWIPVSTKSTGEVFSIRSFTSNTLSVVVGVDPSAVSNGIGVPQTWYLAESLGSPAPYSCSPPTRFRVFGP